jgi:hypothetical protein
MEPGAKIVAIVVCMYVVAKLVQMFVTAPTGKPGDVLKGIAVLVIIGTGVGMARLAGL